MKVIQVVPRRETATKLTTLLNTTERELRGSRTTFVRQRAGRWKHKKYGGWINWTGARGGVLVAAIQGQVSETEERLPRAHHPEWCEVGLGEELWRSTTSQIRTAEEMRAYIEEAFAAQRAGTALPF